MPKSTLSPDQNLSPTKIHLLFPPRIKVERGAISRDVRARVWDFTGGRCWYCGFHLNPFTDFCVDHVVPLARGGADAIENFVPCCAYCNQAKGAKLLREWRINFRYASELDEEPWIDPSGKFFFERDSFWNHRRNSEIRTYRRVQSRVAF